MRTTAEMRIKMNEEVVNLIDAIRSANKDDLLKIIFALPKHMTFVRNLQDICTNTLVHVLNQYGEQISNPNLFTNTAASIDSVSSRITNLHLETARLNIETACINRDTASAQLESKKLKLKFKVLKMAYECFPDDDRVKQIIRNVALNLA